MFSLDVIVNQSIINRVSFSVFNDFQIKFFQMYASNPYLEYIVLNDFLGVTPAGRAIRCKSSLPR